MKGTKGLTSRQYKFGKGLVRIVKKAEGIK
jgi:hypothetical protein